MNNSFLFLSDALIQALGWTLLHSLWQGAAIALILWLILPRLKKASQRYWASYTALLAVLLAALVSFAWVYNYQTLPLAQENAAAAQSEILITDATLGIATVESGFWQTLATTLEPYHPLIVSIWLLGFCFFLFQLISGLHFVYRLRHQHNQPLEPVWQQKLNEIAAQIRLTRPVGLLESALIKAPLALGFLKPLILLPIGMANQLAPAEVEAILAHELAHIARRDWLFNLLQAFIEALFYFHPAIWWMAATIRAERENCCDDTAIALTGNPLVYAKTLVQLQEIAHSPPSPTLALGMEGSPNLLRRRPLLLERIKRILHQPQQSTSPMEKTIALAILVALITLLTVRANTPPAFVENIQAMAEKPMAWFAQLPQVNEAWQAVGDTVPKPTTRQRIVREDDDQVVEMELEDGKVTQLIIDGQEIKAEDYGQHEKLINGLREEAVAPPTPPTPPTPGSPVWEMPSPPTAPFVTRRRSSSKISTQTDDDGNTIINVERNGQPMKIKVKDGEVWVDDEKIEDGETMDIQILNDAPNLFWQDGNNQLRLEGNHIFLNKKGGKLLEVPGLDKTLHYYQLDKDGTNFIFESEDGAVFEMPEMELEPAEIKRIRAEALYNVKEHHKDLKRELKQYEKDLKKDQKDWSKHQKEAYKEMLEAQRALEEARVIQRQSIERVQRDQQRIVRQNISRARGDNHRIVRFSNRPKSFSSTVLDALVADKLIDDPDNYSFSLSQKDMRVNGKKQSDAMHEKYLKIYQKQSGKAIGGDKIKIRVEN